MIKIGELLKGPWYLWEGKEDSNRWNDTIYNKEGNRIAHTRRLRDWSAQSDEFNNLFESMILHLPEHWELLKEAYLLIREPSYLDEEIPAITKEAFCEKFETLLEKFKIAAKPVPVIETGYSDDGCYTSGEQQLDQRLDCYI